MTGLARPRIGLRALLTHLRGRHRCSCPPGYKRPGGRPDAQHPQVTAVATP